MSHHFHALRLSNLDRACTLHSLEPKSTLLLTDPATHLLTDFLQRKPDTLAMHTSVPEARLRLRQAGTSMALATNAARDYVGVVTLCDINSERPLGLASRRGVSVEDIQVQDVMQALHELPVVHYRDLGTATVGDLVSTFQGTRKPCLLVVGDEPDSKVLRGLVSAAQLVDRLNIRLDLQPRATSFSDIVRAVQGHFN